MSAAAHCSSRFGSFLGRLAFMRNSVCGSVRVAFSSEGADIVSPLGNVERFIVSAYALPVCGGDFRAARPSMNQKSIEVLRQRCAAHCSGWSGWRGFAVNLYLLNELHEWL